MNTIFKFTRLVFALVLALSALGISTSAALADKPTKWEWTYTGSFELTNMCAFPITLNATLSATDIDFFDNSGSLPRYYNHIVEQDTFTANGKTLVGIPYVTNMEVLFDSNGNITHIYARGIVEKVPLPDGSLFISAGRSDVPVDIVFLLPPDKGNPGNIAGFCAALAP